MARLSSQLRYKRNFDKSEFDITRLHCIHNIVYIIHVTCIYRVGQKKVIRNEFFSDFFVKNANFYIKMHLLQGQFYLHMIFKFYYNISNGTGVV
jgi:hypothetical protein